MDFLLSAAQREFQMAVRALAQRELAPRATAADRDARFPPENLVALAEAGLLGLAVPREFGGQQRGALDYALAMEEIAAACAATSVLVSVHNSLVAGTISCWWSVGPKERYI